MHCHKCKVVNPARFIVVKRGGEVTGIICTDCNTLNCKRYRKTPEGRKKIYKTVYASMKKHRNKQLARKKLARALKNGKVIKQNCKCGSDKTEAHHTDYSNPLVVVWLCRECHSKLHKKLIPTSSEK